MAEPKGSCLLALDVGNTQTVAGVFQGERVIHRWRLSTEASRTTDEFRIAFSGLMRESDLGWDEIEAVILSSVVPRVTENLRGLAASKELLVVDHSLSYGFTLKLPLPEQLGADRLVNAEAVMQKYGAPAIIIDCGTATTLCAVNGKREYVGGMIAPGIQISIAALIQRAARLAGVELRLPPRAIANTTEDNIRSGVMLGHAAMIDGMVARFKEELAEENVQVVATGGYVPMLAPAFREVDHIDPDLTLDGLRFIWQRNRKTGGTARG